MADPNRIELTMEQAEEIVGRPRGDWAGACHGVSAALAPHVGGKVRRGYFTGEIAPGAYFAGRPSQHSWIELPDGQVLDPTRFAFVGGDPELWVGPADDYDIGGCRSQGASGPAPHIMDTEKELIELNLGCTDYLANCLGAEPMDYGEDHIMVSIEQLHWLAHLAITDSEAPGFLSRSFAAEVYEGIINAGYKALIPIDRLAWILPEEVPNYQP